MIESHTKTDSIINTYSTMAFVIAEMRGLTPRQQRARIESARLGTWGRFVKGTNPTQKEQFRPESGATRPRPTTAIAAAARRLENKVNARERQREEEGND